MMKNDPHLLDFSEMRTNFNGDVLSGLKKFLYEKYGKGIFGKLRLKHVVEARYMAYHIAEKETNVGLAYLSSFLFGQTHSMVIHAREKFSIYHDLDPVFRHKFAKFKADWQAFKYKKINNQNNES